MDKFLSFVCCLLLSGCSLVGETGVETAPYKVLENSVEHNIEVREYAPMVLVSTAMPDDGENSAFRRLFNYIAGDNAGAKEIAMTAPVFMDENTSEKAGTEIAMTAPVFMNNSGNEGVMSFVMPADFTVETTPSPNNPDVWVSQLEDYKVAAITFSGFMSKSNIKEHTETLIMWIENSGYIAKSKPVEAAYNGPFTIPWFKRNEVLIEIE